MKKTLTLVLVAAFVLSMGMIAACGGNTTKEDVCEYDDASESCQMAHDCCLQYMEWTEESGQAGPDQEACDSFTCIGMQDVSCEQFIMSAVTAETSYQQDFPACH